MNRETYMKNRGLPAAKRIRSEIATALGKIQMRQLEEELSEQFGRSLLEQIENAIDAAFGFGMEEQERIDGIANCEHAAWRRERFMAALLCDEAKLMTKEQREIYALRAFAGYDDVPTVAD